MTLLTLITHTQEDHNIHRHFLEEMFVYSSCSCSYFSLSFSFFQSTLISHLTKGLGTCEDTR